MATFAQIDTAFPSVDDPAEPASAVTVVSNEQGSGDSNPSRSPLSGLAGGFFKGLTGSEKKTKADGQAPKRRGPKPDSKPALTRRQQLNRQAQRTHRERKELYIKALEQEVLRLKDTYGSTVRERDAVFQENKRLREILTANGIQVPNLLASPDDRASSGSISGSYPPSSTRGHSPSNNGISVHQGGNALQPPGGGAKLDYDQIGIDFVLALERPCMDHMQMLCVKSNDSEADISGHALMATCPPQNHLLEHPEVQYPHKMPDLHSADLLKLLDLSNRLPLEGEITPVMAWACILRDERMSYLDAQDFSHIKEDLLAKVRCYGFGAVLEEFEVNDSLSMALVSRMESNVSIQDSHSQSQEAISSNGTTPATTAVQATA